MVEVGQSPPLRRFTHRMDAGITVQREVQGLHAVNLVLISINISNSSNDGVVLHKMYIVLSVVVINPIKNF